MPKTPFVAPAGIRMVRIDRVSGNRVFGTFPTTEDPKSSVIWEAFQPETEPRRSFRREGRLALSESRRRQPNARSRRAAPARSAATRTSRASRRAISCKGRAGFTRRPPSYPCLKANDHAR